MSDQAAMVSKSERTWILVSGFAGLAAAILVGAGEGLLQFNAAGGYEAPDYSYFAAVPVSRMTAGHFLAVLAAPLYVAGYWHLSKMLEPAGPRLAKFVFFAGAYSFIVGTAWISQRVFLGLTAHEIAAGADLSTLLVAFSERNEPLVNVLRVAMLIISVIWIFLIVRGKSHYPRWMAFFSPIVLLVSIFALYFAAPTIGVYFLPIAMNVVHAIVFGLSLVVALGLPKGRA